MPIKLTYIRISIKWIGVVSVHLVSILETISLLGQKEAKAIAMLNLKSYSCRKNVLTSISASKGSRPAAFTSS